MKIKICGLTNVINANQIASLTPDFVGFIFTEKSKRKVSISVAKQVMHAKKIGVFVNQTFAEISDHISKINLYGVQLHGNESVSLCEQIKRIHPEVKIIKAFSIQNITDFNTINDYEKVIDYYLFDSKGTQHGGNGFLFDWQLVNQIQINKPYFLSGGIDLSSIENLKNLKQKPFALDVNSKLEDQIGIKNITKTKNIIDYVKSI